MASDQPLKPWRKTQVPLKVTYLWWYDTIAILPEYDDTEEGVLPAGELLREVEVDESGRVICDLHDRRRLEKTQLPKGRIRRIPPFSFVTPLQAILTPEDFAANTEITDAPESTGFFSVFRRRKKAPNQPPQTTPSGRV